MSEVSHGPARPADVAEEPDLREADPLAGLDVLLERPPAAVLHPAKKRSIVVGLMKAYTSKHNKKY